MKDKRPIILASLFDIGYASRGLVAIESSQIPIENVRVLALDGSTFEALDQIGVHVTSLDAFVQDRAELKSVLGGRTWAEQIFTLGPQFLDDIAATSDEWEWLVYIDADIYFHKPISAYLEEFSEASAVIAPHRHYKWNEKRLRKYGEFNVGVVAFRNSIEGRAILTWWAKSCLDKCRDIPDGESYADQKYLEKFPELFPQVAIDGRIGANLAPWNSSLRKIELSASGQLTVDEHPLIYSHMQGLKRRSSKWTLGHLQYWSLAGRALKKLVYLPYLARLEMVAQERGLPKHSNVRASRQLHARLIQGASSLLQAVFLQNVSLRAVRKEKVNDPSERSF